jgi:hypothetical protein
MLEPGVIEALAGEIVIIGVAAIFKTVLEGEPNIVGAELTTLIL